MKNPKIPKILFIGDVEPELKSIQNEIYEDSSLEVKYIKNDNKKHRFIVFTGIYPRSQHIGHIHSSYKRNQQPSYLCVTDTKHSERGKNICDIRWV